MTRDARHRCQSPTSANARGEIVASEERHSPAVFFPEGIQLNHDHTRAAVKPEARSGLISVPTLETDLDRLSHKPEVIEAQTVEGVSSIAFLDRVASEHRA